MMPTQRIVAQNSRHHPGWLIFLVVGAFGCGLLASPLGLIDSETTHELMPLGAALGLIAGMVVTAHPRFRAWAETRGRRILLLGLAMTAGALLTVAFTTFHSTAIIASLILCLVAAAFTLEIPKFGAAGYSVGGIVTIAFGTMIATYGSLLAGGNHDAAIAIGAQHPVEIPIIGYIIMSFGIGLIGLGAGEIALYSHEIGAIGLIGGVGTNLAGQIGLTAALVDGAVLRPSPYSVPVSIWLGLGTTAIVGASFALINDKKAAFGLCEIVTGLSWTVWLPTAISGQTNKVLVIGLIVGVIVVIGGTANYVRATHGADPSADTSQRPIRPEPTDPAEYPPTPTGRPLVGSTRV